MSEVDAVGHLVRIRKDLGVKFRITDVLRLSRLERRQLNLLLRPEILDVWSAKPLDEFVRLIRNLRRLGNGMRVAGDDCHTRLILGPARERGDVVLEIAANFLANGVVGGGGPDSEDGAPLPECLFATPELGLDRVRHDQFAVVPTLDELLCLERRLAIQRVLHRVEVCPDAAPCPYEHPVGFTHGPSVSPHTVYVGA